MNCSYKLCLRLCYYGLFNINHFSFTMIYQIIDVIIIKEVSLRSAALKKANVECKTTSNKLQKIEDTSFNLAKAVFGFRKYS
jgi:hypothetical protein